LTGWALWCILILMRTVTKEEFKAKADELFNALEKEGESILVTANGQDVAKLEPIKKKSLIPAEILFADSRSSGIQPPPLDVLLEPLEDWNDTNWDGKW